MTIHFQVRGTYPSARRRHCSVVSNGKVYLFGGTMPLPCHPLSTTNYNGMISPSGLADLSDLHVLDFGKGEKIKIKTGKFRFSLKKIENSQFCL